MQSVTHQHCHIHPLLGPIRPSLAPFPQCSIHHHHPSHFIHSSVTQHKTYLLWQVSSTVHHMHVGSGFSASIPNYIAVAECFTGTLATASARRALCQHSLRYECALIQLEIVVFFSSTKESGSIWDVYEFLCVRTTLMRKQMESGCQ